MCLASIEMIYRTPPIIEIASHHADALAVARFTPLVDVRIAGAGYDRVCKRRTRQLSESGNETNLEYE